MFELIKDENNKLSSTRVALLATLILFCYSVVMGLEVDPMVWTIINSVLMVCLGGTTARAVVEKYSK